MDCKQRHMGSVRRRPTDLFLLTANLGWSLKRRPHISRPHPDYVTDYEMALNGTNEVGPRKMSHSTEDFDTRRKAPSGSSAPQESEGSVTKFR